MSAEIVTVTIDDREVQVGKGIGLVEADPTAASEIARAPSETTARAAG